MTDEAQDQKSEAKEKSKKDAKLEHTEGGRTTRDDPLDQGVPMLPGSPDEPVGPEDALGEGPKRGDYRDRVSGDPHQAVPTEDGGEVKVDDETGAVERTPTAELVPQLPRTEDIGDAEGEKGGVDTDPRSE